jgi:hypothetical protein
MDEVSAPQRMLGLATGPYTAILAVTAQGSALAAGRGLGLAMQPIFGRVGMATASVTVTAPAMVLGLDAVSGTAMAMAAVQVTKSRTPYNRI